MRRFYLPPQECQSEILALTGGEAHHAANVLRLRPGEDAVVLDGEGREYICRVENADRKRVEFKILQAKFSPGTDCAITLAQAIPRGAIFESIIQKATELGVRRIIPLLSERVTTHLDDESAERKAAKWQQTAIEAIKQCGQLWLPKVEQPVALHALLARREKYDLGLVGSLHGGARHPREYFRNYERTNRRRPENVIAWIGPEGDFTAAEVTEIANSGARPITLGPLILRSETAALYTLSIINYELTASPA